MEGAATFLLLGEGVVNDDGAALFFSVVGIFSFVVSSVLFKGVETVFFKGVEVVLVGGVLVRVEVRFFLARRAFKESLVFDK